MAIFSNLCFLPDYFSWDSLLLSDLYKRVIAFVIHKIRDIVTRFQECQKMKTNSQNVLTTLLGDPNYVARATRISLEKLENLMGLEGLLEVPIIDDKVDADNITVLKADEQEEQLNNILKSNGGVIKLAA